MIFKSQNNTENKLSKWWFIVGENKICFTISSKKDKYNNWWDHKLLTLQMKQEIHYWHCGSQNKNDIIIFLPVVFFSKNGSHELICSNIFSPIAGIVWEGLWDVTFLVEVYHWRWTCPVHHACLSLPPTYGSRCKLTAVLVSMTTLWHHGL